MGIANSMPIQIDYPHASAQSLSYPRSNLISESGKFDALSLCRLFDPPPRSDLCSHEHRELVRKLEKLAAALFQQPLEIFTTAVFLFLAIDGFPFFVLFRYILIVNIF